MRPLQLCSFQHVTKESKENEAVNVPENSPSALINSVVTHTGYIASSRRLVNQSIDEIHITGKFSVHRRRVEEEPTPEAGEEPGSDHDQPHRTPRSPTTSASTAASEQATRPPGGASKSGAELPRERLSIEGEMLAPADNDDNNEAGLDRLALAAEQSGGIPTAPRRSARLVQWAQRPARPTPAAASEPATRRRGRLVKRRADQSRAAVVTPAPPSVAATVTDREESDDDDGAEPARKDLPTEVVGEIPASSRAAQVATCSSDFTMSTLDSARIERSIAFSSKFGSSVPLPVPFPTYTRTGPTAPPAVTGVDFIVNEISAFSLYLETKQPKASEGMAAYKVPAVGVSSGGSAPGLGSGQSFGGGQQFGGGQAISGVFLHNEHKFLRQSARLQSVGPGRRLRQRHAALATTDSRAVQQQRRRCSGRAICSLSRLQLWVPAFGAWLRQRHTALAATGTRDVCAPWRCCSGPTFCSSSWRCGTGQSLPGRGRKGGATVSGEGGRGRGTGT